MTQTLLEAALSYGAVGYRVHPCRPDDKRPLTMWSEAATTDPGTLERYWTRWPNALIGLCTGSGLVVVDDDRGRDEPEDDLVLTRTAKTRSRGWHHYFKTDEAHVPNRVGIIPGIDIRGDGGYVIAPPSPGWAWHNVAEVQFLPDWVMTILRAERERKRLGPGFEPAPASSVGEGYRHDYMVRFAGWAISVLGIDNVDDLTVECWHEYQRACAPADAPFANIQRIARSIWRRDQS